MDGFDTSTMTYMATGGNVQYDDTSEAYSKMLMDSFDQGSNFDAHTFAGSEDIYGLHQQPTPSLKRFPTTYDDTFSDVVSAFENVTNQETHEGETSVSRDHKLLGFSMPNLDYVLLDYTYRQTSIPMTAQLHGMFFLAESPWANGGDGGTPPVELTCYRRNLFQITGNVTLPRALRCILTNEGKQIAIISQELVVTATESTEGNSVKLISVPWKTPANVNPPSSDDKVEREPPAISLDVSNIQDIDSEYATFPFQWKRLQFRIATANNGRRKELQQHFVLHLKIMATLATGGKVSIATAQSGPIIVRGRSPRNFQSRKDTPLTGAGNHARKSSVIPAHLQRLDSTESGPARQQHPKIEPTSAPVKTDAPAPPVSVASFYDPNDFSMHPALFDNTFLPDSNRHFQHSQARQGAMTALPQDSLTYEAGPANNGRGYPISSPDLSRPHDATVVQAQSSQDRDPAVSTNAAPMKLSLVDEDSPKHNPNANIQNSQHHPPKRVATMPPPQLPSTFSLNVVSSPDESADLLYEYFPLTLDDWMPPVDAVYRPHVVHHIKPLVSGPDGTKGGIGAGGARGTAAGVWAGRSKRYFSEDVG
ncbi:hypothetical protein BDV97DRAFT_397461 [Delphinella strobiligena]|nr:hypothetical protein BDV97DRAFT_397461 [Delphinella strobiligena]